MSDAVRTVAVVAACLFVAAALCLLLYLRQRDQLRVRADQLEEFRAMQRVWEDERARGVYDTNHPIASIYAVAPAARRLPNPARGETTRAVAHTYRLADPPSTTRYYFAKLMRYLLMRLRGRMRGSIFGRAGRGAASPTGWQVTPVAIAERYAAPPSFYDGFPGAGVQAHPGACGGAPHGALAGSPPLRSVHTPAQADGPTSPSIQHLFAPAVSATAAALGITQPAALTQPASHHHHHHHHPLLMPRNAPIHDPLHDAPERVLLPPPPQQLTPRLHPLLGHAPPPRVPV